MKYNEFQERLDQPEPPENLSALQKALWYDAQGNWDRAHQLAQNEDGSAAARIHAYLHRKEGDQSNASYWYRRAGTDFFEDSLEEEWEELARTLFEDQ